jgi:hypothetical protein
MALCLVAVATAAWAGVSDAPGCRERVARAWQLVDVIVAREKQVRKGDMVAACRVLRSNLRDMAQARADMDACMTGHDRGENVGQMDVSMEDIRAVLAAKCR